MKKIFFIFGLLLLTINMVNAVNAPTLHCVQVNDDGSTTLTWEIPSDPSNFQKYSFQYSTDGNAYFDALADITTFATTTTTISNTTVNANTYPKVYFKIMAHSTIGTTPYPSDVVTTIDFRLNTSTGKATLIWSRPGGILPASHASNYEIQGKNEWSSDFTEIAKKPYSNNDDELSYEEIINFCKGEKSYRIVLADTKANCSNVSREQYDEFEDSTMPEMPVLDSVAVNYNTGLTRLGWKASTSTDVNKYIIYIVDGPVTPIDTVSGRLTTSWTDSLRNPSNKVYTYRISAEDSCGKPSPQTELQSTMLITTVFDHCTKSCELTWTEYINMRDGVDEYEIYFSVNDGILQHAGTVSGSTTSYKLENLLSNGDYKVIVRAVNQKNRIRASSAICRFVFKIEDANNRVSIRNVTVTNNEYITISATLNGDIYDFNELLLYRSETGFVNRTLIAKVPYNRQITFVYADKSVNVQKKEFFYDIELTNDCGAVVAASNIMHNILLKGVADRDIYRNYIEWSEFGEWESGVFNYAIYRKFQIESRAIFLAEKSFTEPLYHVHDVADSCTFGGEFSYYVEAMSNPDDDGNADTSRSNTLILKQLPKNFMPNAFNPAIGFNQVFMPVNSYIDIKTYVFAIYSRNGQLVFHTTDPNKGWDGTLDGKPAPLGVYVYYVTYEFPNGEVLKRPGTVTLIR